METTLVEIRSAEGGDDAKLLVLDQFRIYGKYCQRLNLEMSILDERPGMLTFQVSGKGAVKAFEHENGGMRHQRIPPTEKRGRVHTSTVTVAVMPVPRATDLVIDERDLEWKTCRSGGKGGQNVNKVESAVQLTYLPTGLQVRCEGERSQLFNREAAINLLRAKLLEQKKSAADKARNDARKEKIGSGMRSDKVRTYRAQDGIVTDHRSGKKAPYDRVLRGFLEDLF